MPIKYILVSHSEFPFITRSFMLHSIHICVCVCVCFVVGGALRPKSTAMVMAEQSVHITTFFPGQPTRYIM